MEKIRAPRNRTLTLTDEERRQLRQELAPLPPEGALSADMLTDRIVNADLMHLLPRLPREFADLLVVDPPYNLSKDYGTCRFRRLAPDDYARYVRSWLPDLVQCLKPSGSIYVCSDWQSSQVICQELERVALVKNRITWQREKGRGAARNWKNGMEDIWFAVRDDNAYHFDLQAVKQRHRVVAPYRQQGQPKDWQESDQGRFRLTCPSNFWDDICVPYWSMPENTDHPTQKPEKLIAKLILASCPPGGLLFDPFMGSGTGPVTAKKLGRRYFGVEIDEEYTLLALKRLHQADANPSIQGYRDGIFLPRHP